MTTVSVTIPVIVTRTGRGNRLYLAHTFGFDACGESKETETEAIESCLREVRKREKLLSEIHGYPIPQERKATK